MSAIARIIYQADSVRNFKNPKESIENDVLSAAKRLDTYALEDVFEEKDRQVAKWGEQNHNPYIYLTILVEEVGEIAQAILQTQFGGPKGGFANIRKEAVHACAVALAAIECLDRDKWLSVVEFPYPEGDKHP